MVLPAKGRLLSALALTLTAAPQAQTVLGIDRDLGIDDGEITPDGRYGVVRMNGYDGELRVYDMATGNLVQQHNCGTMLLQMENQDGVAVTNERAVIIGNCAVFGDLTAVGTSAFHMASHVVGVAGPRPGAHSRWIDRGGPGRIHRARPSLRPLPLRPGIGRSTRLRAPANRAGPRRRPTRSIRSPSRTRTRCSCPKATRASAALLPHGSRSSSCIPRGEALPAVAFETGAAGPGSRRHRARPDHQPGCGARRGARGRGRSA